jgi:flagellar motor protein MotB
MKKSFTKTHFHRFSILFVIGCVALTGCQRRASNGQVGSDALFDLSKRPTWMGGNSQYANNGSANPKNSSIYDSQIPDLNINDGSSGSGQQLANNGASQVQNLNQRIGAFDVDNQLLNTEVASLQQKLQLANQYNQQLKEQLAGTTSQVQQVFSERQTAAQQVAALQMQLEQSKQNLRLAQTTGQPTGQLAGSSGGVPSQFASSGGATIRANNSLLQKLNAIQIPGGAARMDGDVIRIEFPTDRLFVSGSYQIQPAQKPVLQNIAGTIRESFPQQIVGIEAHWDNTPLNPAGTTDQQLTATQSLAVFEQLVKLGLPQKQLFTMAMASNRPRHPQGMVGGVSPNRRIELVIYPEKFDGP